MCDENDDFLTTRLGDIVTIESNNMDSHEEAVPWLCWGRGGTRPSLSQLNFERFLEISARFNSNIAAKNDPDTLPSFQAKPDSIMENITSECCDIFGNPATDKHIAEWLQQSFSEATECQNNDKQPKGNFQESLHTHYNFVNGKNKNSIQLTNSDPNNKIDNMIDVNSALCTSSQVNNNNMIKEGTVSPFCLLKPKTTDHEYNDPLCPPSSHQLYSTMDKQCVREPPPGLTFFSKRNLGHVQNRSQSFIIENLPNGIKQNDLKQVLNSFGTVENILIRESKGNVTAVVRMGAECDCLWLVDCLNGTEPFGASYPLTFRISADKYATYGQWAT